MADSDLSYREKARALREVIRFNPVLLVIVLATSLVAAALEGIGMGFLLPIIKTARTSGEPSGRLVELFVSAYDVIGVPFTLEYIVVGLVITMAIRFTATFLFTWLRMVYSIRYEQYLKETAFDRIMNAEVGHIDELGSDYIINTLVTKAKYSRSVARDVLGTVNTLAIAFVYAAIAFYLSPWLTLLAATLLAGITFAVRFLLEPAASTGEDISEAENRIQNVVQSGVQGIRDVKVFRLTDSVVDRFEGQVDEYADKNIHLRRNEAAINNLYQFVSSVTVFVLLYISLVATNLELGEIALFLFAMYRLSPRVSQINNRVYRIEGRLPHLIETEEFLENAARRNETDEGTTPAPERIDSVTYDSVTFAYDKEPVLKDVSFSVEAGEFIAFVGQSGAGKSTIVSLLGRYRSPDSGEIRADDIPIGSMPLEGWRERLAVVRQDPYIFNRSLRENLIVGRPDASETDIKHVCEVAKVSEFIDDLEDGLDTELGDEGVRLSGGQRQRVAIARALLCDADILVLDEASSNLDLTLEEKVHNAIERTSDNIITMVIAHRMSTVTGADRIYMMDDGEVIEIGSHQELMRRNGAYADLYTSQAGEGKQDQPVSDPPHRG